MSTPNLDFNVLELFIHIEFFFVVVIIYCYKEKYPAIIICYDKVAQEGRLTLLRTKVGFLFDTHTNILHYFLFVVVIIIKVGHLKLFILIYSLLFLCGSSLVPSSLKKKKNSQYINVVNDKIP